MKSILSRRGFSIDKRGVSADVLTQHRQQLTITPHVEREEYAHLSQPIKIYQETEQRLYVPRFYAAANIGPPETDKLTTQPFERCDNLVFQGKMLPAQLPVVDAAKRALDTFGGGVISINCGGGKTAISLFMACVYKVPVGVVCNTTSMMKQWHERIKQFVPKARIGIVQRDRIEIEGKDIVIMSVKTLAMRDYPKDAFERLGLIVWDEVHLYPTTLFSLAFPKLTTKYSLGLSATPFRKDKCEQVINNYIGPIIYLKKRDRDTSIEARCVSLQMENIEAPTNKYGKIMYTTMAVTTVKRPERTEFIARLIAGLTTAGRTVLVLGEYVEQLKMLAKELGRIQPKQPLRDQQFAWLMGKHKRLGAKSPIRLLPRELVRHIAERYIVRDATVGLYIGAMKCEQRKESEAKDVILGTYKLASVGMDIGTLNTLVFASPRKEIEQSVGRILRKQTDEGGIKPLIVDIIDNHGVFQSQGRERKKFYRQYGYTIVHQKMLPDGTVLSTRTVRAAEEDEVAGPDGQEEGTKECLFD